MSIPRKVALFTNEYPPSVYGGAGVHVEYLARALARRITVEVRCFGDQGGDQGGDQESEGNPLVRGYPAWAAAKEGGDPRFGGAIDAFARSLAMAKDRLDADLVHCHTWYTDMGGLIAGKLWGVPYVLTIHSLEPLRPWKVEQLGNAYHLSTWMERTAIEEAQAIIAVSQGTRADVLRLFDVDPARVHVIHNGIDPQEYRRDGLLHPESGGGRPAGDGRGEAPDTTADVLRRHGVDPDRPFLLFVGRITRQKGIIHLVNAIPAIDPDLQIVLAAGAPDTPEIGAEMEARVAEVSAKRRGVVWIREMLPREQVIQLYARAAVFCCPSVYEPFGIINLEAMACETAVVAAAVGGIPEVVVPEETGLLVDPGLAPGSFEPADPSAFSNGLATAINRLARDSDLRQRMGEAGRRRAVERFSWDVIAERTVELYRSLL